MRIEAEVHGSPLDHPGEGEGGGGCDAPPSAQEASIGRPDSRQPGCGPAQSAFDCEHFQFIDEDEDEQEGPAAAADPPGTMSGGAAPRKELKSLLKRKGGEGGGGSSSRPKGRVTFDEAVALYSDENEGVRLLQLTTGPDILCADQFYFEPPVEYRDVPPFEPPAEYRDAAVQNGGEGGGQQQPPPPCDCTCALEIMAANAAAAAAIAVAKQAAASGAQQVAATPDDTPEEHVTEAAEDVTVEAPAPEEPEPPPEPDDTTPQPPPPSTTTEPDSQESDTLFERFLEAEREFAVDEELNSVFHELDSDFANDIGGSGGGALDDNFFRKLITLLSSAEGGDALLGDGDFFSSTQFPSEGEDDDSSQAHSRTLSEADSDCSISSQDTIIVRLGEDGAEQPVREPDVKSPDESVRALPKQQDIPDEVFGGKDAPPEESNGRPRPVPRESLAIKNIQQTYQTVRDPEEESLSRQSSGEQSATSQDHPQDADDSTSSDSRSGEVEEEIRLDDIGYDEEDAEDYDEESFRGMAHGNSKIRRIIKKNALQCTLFRGIEAKRRQQPGSKYPRPKSPLLSQESLVEKLKWLTTVDEHGKDAVPQDGHFHPKPPDVILSTGGVPVNGSHNPPPEDKSGGVYQQFYPVQQRFAGPPGRGGYYVRHDGYHPSLPRQKGGVCPGHPQPPPSRGAAQYRFVGHPQWNAAGSMTVPRNFRDWRIIQRGGGAAVGNGSARSAAGPVQADYVRCANGGQYPPDVSRTVLQAARGANPDELEQFVEQDSKRLERIRRRYSVAEEEEDPTFGFARRPSVRGVQQPLPSDRPEPQHYVVYEEGPGVHPRSAADQMRLWNRDPNWRPDPYGGAGRPAPMHIHRASVALTELPGSSTLPYRKQPPPPDPRYHSYAESMYGGGGVRTLLGGASKGWPPPDPGLLQVPPAPDERGVPEGASSSPKVSTDSLYHSPVPDPPPAGAHKDEGVIYYSLNV